MTQPTEKAPRDPGSISQLQRRLVLTASQLRLGDSLTRATPDLDTAFRGDQEQFQRELGDNLKVGWGHFTGSVSRGRRRPPVGVPASYVMQPLIVKLQYHG